MLRIGMHVEQGLAFQSLRTEITLDSPTKKDQKLKIVHQTQPTQGGGSKVGEERRK